MTTVHEIETQAAEHRNVLNKHAQRQKKLTKLVEKEQPFRDALHIRSVGVVQGTPGCKRVSLALSHNLAYKERRLKRYSDELVAIDSERQDAAKKLAGLEETLAEVQAQVASAELAERKAEIAASLGVEPSAIADHELTPRP